MSYGALSTTADSSGVYDDDILTVSLTDLNNTIRYETTRRSVNVRSEADTSQLNLPHGNDN